MTDELTRLRAENERLREALNSERQFWFHELENLALRLNPKGRDALHYAIRHMTAQIRERDAALQETTNDG